MISIGDEESSSTIAIEDCGDDGGGSEAVLNGGAISIECSSSPSSERTVDINSKNPLLIPTDGVVAPHDIVAMLGIAHSLRMTELEDKLQRQLAWLIMHEDGETLHRLLKLLPSSSPPTTSVGDDVIVRHDGVRQQEADAPAKRQRNAQ